MEAFEGAVQRNAVNFSGGRTFLSSFRSDLKETLLPDDPFRHLKGRPAGVFAVGLLRYFVPILEWAPRYSFAKFRYDLLAGVTIASLAIPQGISYARLANLPPVIGLCKNVASAYTSAIYSEKNDFYQFDSLVRRHIVADSSFVPPLVYALFGSSTSLAVGTVAGASLFMASIIGTVASATEDPQLYSNLFFTAAFCTGVIEAALGVLRLI